NGVKTGDARFGGQQMAVEAMRYAAHVGQSAKPFLLVSGGEFTVKIPKGVKPGSGGRNTLFLLAFLLATNGRKGVHAISIGTDGMDFERARGGVITDISFA